MKHVLLLGSHAPSLVNFRGPLIQELRGRGHAVSACAPELLADANRKWLEARGVVCHNAPLSRVGLNPFSDLKALVLLTKQMRRLKPDLFLGYTIKPVIWGLLAAWAARVPRRYALIPGLGFAFTGEARGKRGLVNSVVRVLYRLALAHADKVFFQNPDDEALFRTLRLVPVATPTVVVNGSGIDCDGFSPAPLPAGPMSFLLIARLIGDKGIRQYAAAARLVRQRHPEVTFHLVGGTDANPEGIPASEVEAWHREGILHWHGALADVRPAIAAAHVFVLPSYYREGTPRSVLEAMAMGRAIITTDAPGCRETVREGVNGFLVPVRDSGALAAALLRFVEQPDLAQSMGAASREIAVERYDVHKVNAIMLREMGL